ncbi:recombination protein NinB [Massilia sp. UBA6681]|uniref:recombination protein NinB n=1 Tax=Massilia sp. UBA6681 TaxID=1946839 RepID=UPI0025C6A6AE|nr:recombination protein NinB [Massilia sp. UBA6681]
MKRTFILAHDAARQNAIRYIAEAPAGYCVTVAEPTRTLEQNALMWPLLQKLADQVVWYGVKLSADDWKDLLTASLRKQRSAPGLDGGFVVFGERTRTYSKAEFSELIELIYAFGAQQGVEFGKVAGVLV